MSLRSIFKGAMLVTASAALIAVITIAGILALAFYYSDGGRSWSVSITHVSDALTYDGTEYDFSGDELWIAEKFQSNPDIAGSPRNSFRASLSLEY